MSLLLLLALVLAITGVSDASWCICRSDAETNAIQKTLDYACGAGADCLPIHQKGACYEPDTVVSHCSYAANSFFQKSGQQAQACDFSGTAAITSNDPSYGSCSYPSTASATVGTSPTSTTAATTPPVSTTSTPTSFTPATGVLGGGIGTTDNDGVTTDGIGTARGGEGYVFSSAVAFSLLLVLQMG